MTYGMLVVKRSLSLNHPDTGEKSELLCRRGVVANYFRDFAMTAAAITRMFFSLMNKKGNLANE